LSVKRKVASLAMFTLLLLSMLSFAINIKPAKASEATQMLISPEMLTLPIGASFTVTINVTNVERLFGWQVILKYNGSVINCTDVWVPAENVFKGKIYATAGPAFGKDYIDGYDYMMFTASLQGENFVNVDNGILFKANFTVINAGATRITFATKEQPVHVDHYTFESFLLDYDLNEISFDVSNFCTVKTPVITAIIVVPDDYPTIQEAINHAKDGDTVFVRSGIYYEHVVVNKTISLIGENRSDTIIDGSGTGIILDIVANGTAVRGFKIQNGGMGIWSSLKVYNCSIVSNSITNCYSGIACDFMPNSTVSYNEVTNCTKGIGILCNSTVVGNTLMNNREGLYIFEGNNFLRNNTMKNNEFNFGHISKTMGWIEGYFFNFFNNDVDVSNTINGKPIYYWINEHDKEIPLDAAYVELVNCTNILVHDLNLSHNEVGLVLVNSKNCIVENLSIKYNYYWGMVLCCGSSNNIVRKNIFALNSCGILVNDNTRENMIFDNNIMENNWGIELMFTNCTYNNIFRNNITANREAGIFLERGAHDNSIYGNNISNNGCGLFLMESSNNSILHNNFVNNKGHVHDYSWDEPLRTPSINCWDDGYPSGGNYWSDYTDVDLCYGSYQNQTGSDGIWDHPFIISENNTDRYPLVNPWTPISIYVQGIDVSHHQGDINWSKVYGAGYRFAFAKATEGDHRPPVIIDPNFVTNMENGREAGLLMGAYHLAHPETNNATDEALFFVSVASTYLNESYLRPALDLEQEVVNKVIAEKGEEEGKKYLSNWVETWISTVKEETGVEPIIYVGSTTTRNYLNDSIAKYDLWIAHWTYDPAISPETGIWASWDFWQWSNESKYAPLGYVPGIAGNVDLDLFNGYMQRLYDAFTIPNVKVFNVVWENKTYPITVYSNSTVTHLVFNQTQAQISFNVTGSNGSKGYCNITIPKDLLKGPWTYTMDGETPSVMDISEDENATHSFIYFTYIHAGTFRIAIQGAWVVPEFPSTIILTIFMLTTIILIVLTRYRRLKHRR